LGLYSWGGEDRGLQLVGGLFANEIWGGGAYIREGLFSEGGGGGAFYRNFTACVFGVNRSKHVYSKCRWLFVTKKEKKYLLYLSKFKVRWVNEHQGNLFFLKKKERQVFCSSSWSGWLVSK